MLQLVRPVESPAIPQCRMKRTRPVEAPDVDEDWLVIEQQRQTAAVSGPGQRTLKSPGTTTPGLHSRSTVQTPSSEAPGGAARGFKSKEAAKDKDPSKEVDSSEVGEGEDNAAEDVVAGALKLPEVKKAAVFYNGLYAPSGFDMMNILIRVATRPNPKIDIGAVDTNCALVLCDLEKPDIPIVYCSEGFEALTGYTQTEILGRNCRFLQQSPISPTADAGARFDSADIAPAARGMKRRKPSPPTDDDPTERSKREREDLAEFKELIVTGSEAQVTITNYTKWGMRFTNILTAIPITWGNSPSDQHKYVVGFQANRQNVIFTC